MELEWHASNNVDLNTSTDPLPTVPGTPYLLLDKPASGILGV